MLGDVLHMSRFNDLARRSYRDALALSPSSLDALAGLAALDLEDGRPAAARAIVDAQVRLHPRSATLLLLAGRTALQANAANEAQSFLKRAIDAQPSLMPAYEALGALYVRTQQLPKALDEFTRVEQARPDAIGASTMVAVILEAQGRPSEARAHYEQILARAPRSAIAANNLAWLLLGEGLIEDAVRLAGIAHEELRDAPEVNDTLGWAYLKAGRHPDAIRALADAVQASPGKPLYRYHLGMAFLSAGDVRNARQELGSAIASGAAFPGREEATESLQRIHASDNAQ
jgi:Flp pilus assembly protein TadD